MLIEQTLTTPATIMLLASSPSRLTGLKARGAAASWNAAVERGPMRYLVRWGPSNDPMKYSATVSTPRATLTGAMSGWHVAVKAVNAKGLEGWDWARLTID